MLLLLAAQVCCAIVLPLAAAVITLERHAATEE
jgi:hypothetical protein